MPMDWFPLWLSLRVASLATLLAVPVGLWAAWGVTEGNFRGRGWLEGAFTLPLVLPPTVLGYYLLVLFGQDTLLGRLYEALTGSPLLFHWQAAVLAAAIHTTPLFVLYARAAFERVPAPLIRSARLLGAPAWRIFWRISLPIAARGLAAAALLAFARAFGDFGITLLVAGNLPGRTQTLAVAVFDAATRGEGSLARSLVAVSSLTAILIVALAQNITPQKAKR